MNLYSNEVAIGKSMQEIDFKKDQIDFLLDYIKDEKLRSKFFQGLAEGRIYKKSHPTDQYLILFSNREVELILDELSFLITSIWLNENCEINEFGSIIEDVIDLFLNENLKKR